MSFNVIDGIILLIITVSAWAEMRQGFIMSFARLLGSFVSLLVSLRLNDPLTQFLVQRYDFPHAIAMVLVFLAIWLGVDLILTQIINLTVLPFQQRIQSLPVIKQIDLLLAGFLGGLRGLVIALLLVLPFLVTPIVPAATALTQDSAIGRRITPLARTTFVAIEPLIGRALDSGLISLAPPQRNHARTDLGFRVTEGLRIDEQAEMQMLELVNQERAKAGLPALTFDPELQEVARAHSREMFELGYFSHESPVTGTPADRVRRARISYTITGENLAYAPTLRIAHEGLMNSPGHRANILSPHYGRVGIGVYSSPGRGKMFTQNFRN